MARLSVPRTSLNNVSSGSFFRISQGLLEGRFQLIQLRGDGRQLGMRRVQPQQPNGRVGVEIKRHIEQAGDKALHAQGRACALLDEPLHPLA